MPKDPISVVVLTKDEAANVVECLDAILAQLAEGDEVVVVDAASRDATVELVRRLAQAYPGRLVLHADAQPLSFGAARNLGVCLASNDIVAFVSADAVAEPGWLSALRLAMANADIVYGRQKHAPPVENAATVSRGLRYHHFEAEDGRLPERYASNVNAAYRKHVFSTLVFDERVAGAEDVAFAREARFAGHRIAYTARAVVRHKDVASWRGEWRKHSREGAARAQLRGILGAPVGHIAWALCVGLLAVAAVAWQSGLLLALTLVAFFAPTLRRAISPAARRYRKSALVKGAAASPVFDIAFLTSYLARRFRT